MGQLVADLVYSVSSYTVKTGEQTRLRVVDGSRSYAVTHASFTDLKYGYAVTHEVDLLTPGCGGAIYFGSESKVHDGNTIHDGTSGNLAISFTTFTRILSDEGPGGSAYGGAVYFFGSGTLSVYYTAFTDCTALAGTYGTSLKVST